MPSNQVSVYELSEVYVQSLQKMLELVLKEPDLDLVFRRQALRLQRELAAFLSSIEH